MTEVVHSHPRVWEVLIDDTEFRVEAPKAPDTSWFASWDNEVENLGDLRAGATPVAAIDEAFASHPDDDDAAIARSALLAELLMYYLALDEHRCPVCGSHLR